MAIGVIELLAISMIRPTLKTLHLKVFPMDSTHCRTDGDIFVRVIVRRFAVDLELH